MITWHKVHEGSYEGRVGDVTLAYVWYDAPLLFKKKSVTWVCRTAFPGVGYRGFGSAYPTLDEARRAIEDFIKRVAEAVLTV